MLRPASIWAVALTRGDDGDRAASRQQVSDTPNPQLVVVSAASMNDTFACDALCPMAEAANGDGGS